MWGLLIAFGIFSLMVSAATSRLLPVLSRMADKREGDLKPIHPLFGHQGATAQAMQRHFVTFGYMLGTVATVVGIIGMALNAIP